MQKENIKLDIIGLGEGKVLPMFPKDHPVEFLKNTIDLDPVDEKEMQSATLELTGNNLSSTEPEKPKSNRENRPTLKLLQ